MKTGYLLLSGLLSTMLCFTTAAATCHNNDVYFHASGFDQQNLSIQYTGEYCISDGQPFKGVEFKSDYLRVKAGRDKTAKVANYYRQNNITGNIFCRDAADNRPEELNFAVKCNIIIEGHSYCIYVAQGSSLTYNNWWIGSNGDFFGRPRQMISKDGLYIIKDAGDSNNFDVVKRNNLTPINWMTTIPDQRKLNDISIPGTHDSCTYNIGVSMVFLAAGKCQDWDIGAQLLLGIRALDIRVGTTNSDGGAFTTWHGNMYCNMNFDDVLQSCFRFLDKYPGETIILSVKLEQDGDCPDRKEEILWKYINRYGTDRFWTKDEVPALGDVRGRIVIVNRMDKDSKSAGIKVDFPDNTKGSYSTGTNVVFYIQDFYKSGSGDKLKCLSENFKTLAAGSVKDVPKYIYTSCTDLVNIPPGTPEKLAKEINPKVKEFLAPTPNNIHLGWIMMDFIQPTLVNIIISHNE